MCGITGIYSFNGDISLQWVENAVAAMNKRGPDGHGTYTHQSVALGHARLAVIDTTQAARQPFTDLSGRYTIVYNGEFFNFQHHRKALQDKGVKFISTSDTEVLLQLYIHYREQMLPMINGFFAFAIYDKEEKLLFVARDRLGIKPLMVYSDSDKLIFASELKALLKYPVKPEIDFVSVLCYLQLNYIPPPGSVYKNISKMQPGTYMWISSGNITTKKWYNIPEPEPANDWSYQQAQQELSKLVEDAVQMRLVSDVPLGAFLSGGIDSSVIVALASKHTSQLNTFTIGYKDEPFFDETRYAALVAKMYRTNHTVFSLTENDLFSHFYAFLDYLDEPFADSSALAVFILSEHTRQHVSVALSGDGADELFGGYNKHNAHLRASAPGISEKMLKYAAPVFDFLPKSRNNRHLNYLRQMSRFGKGVKMTDKERYWFWCSIAGESEAMKLLNGNPKDEYFVFKNHLLSTLIHSGDINDILRADQHLVLQGDMLVKTDMMSMANSLEVRVPFLDYRIVEFVQKLPAHFKIDSSIRKKILRDSFREILPEELYHRPKHGFEVPLLKWMKGPLFPVIDNELLSREMIQKQGIFNFSEIEKLKKQLFSVSPGEVQGRIWALMVFQYWWKKYMY